MGKKGEFKYETPEAYIEDKITINHVTKCWHWPYFQKSNGHGKANWRGVNWQAARLSFETYVTDIPKGFDVIHTCGNNACLNPTHLALQTDSQIVSKEDRIARMVATMKANNARKKK